MDSRSGVTFIQSPSRAIAPNTTEAEVVNDVTTTASAKIWLLRRVREMYNGLHVKVE